MLAPEELKSVRRLFKDSKDIFSNIGFFIIRPDYISIGSMRDTNIGTRNLIAGNYPELLKNAFAGKSSFGPLVTSDVKFTQPATPNETRKQPTMFFIGPIYDNTGKVIATFALRVDPWSVIPAKASIRRIGRIHNHDITRSSPPRG